MTVSSGTPTPTDENSPSATPAATNPAVQVNGSNSLNPGDGLDLDTNHLNSGGEDVGLVPNAQNKLLLTTIGNAGMIGFGGSQPSYSQCKAAGVGATSTNVKNLPRNFYICYRTDQGLIGWLRILGFNADTGVLTVQVNTWATP